MYDGGFWFRLFGWGFSISDKIKNPPLFGEREGVLRIRNWGVKLLMPPKTSSWDLDDADPIEDIYRGMLVLSSGYKERKYWALKISQHKRQKEAER